MIRLRWRALTTACVLFLLWSVVWTSHVTAEEDKSEGGPPLVAMEFDDVDIRVFIKFISTLTGKNFVLDNDVKGTINLVSPSRVSPEEAYRVFESVLEVYGFTTIPSGPIVKIVPLRTAKDRGVETLVAPGMPLAGPQDNMVTQIIPLKHANADDLQKVLTPLVSKTSVIAADSKSNTLIVTDVHSNIRRLMEILREIDVSGVENTTSVIELEHASAEDLADKLRLLMEGERKTRPAGKQGEEEVFKVLAVDRINALVVFANKDDTEEIKRLVARLDRPTPSGKDNIHVLYLKNAVAEDIANVLTQFRDQAKTAGAGQATGDRPKAPTISADVVISPDKATNSLVIRSSPQEFKELTRIIEKLDIQRAMVYVEGLVMEVNTDKALRLGVEWHAGNDFDNQSAFWFGGNTAGSAGALGTIFSGLQSSTPVFALPGGLALGVIGRQLTYGGISFPSYSALINAIKSDTDFNILSTPQILTTDNEEAEVRVAQNIPYQTRLDQGTEVTSRAISTFEYKDVGVNLKVTPQINQDRFVRMQIEQEVRSVVRDSTVDSAGNVILAPVTNVRSAKTTVIVKDGETVVLGGLIQDTERGDETRVPCLGSIPVIGWAFKTTSQRREKINLLVFLTPHIIENTEEARAVYQQKEREIKDSLIRQKALQGPGAKLLNDEKPRGALPETPDSSESGNTETPSGTPE
ncbi:MAG: type II secretion system secretin GspD [Deltaproteobacteria bacterium]|nr:type II secretion system secretin GspD [Deltaproteobacteria bacterium]